MGSKLRAAAVLEGWYATVGRMQHSLEKPINIWKRAFSKVSGRENWNVVTCVESNKRWSWLKEEIILHKTQWKKYIHTRKGMTSLASPLGQSCQSFSLSLITLCSDCFMPWYELRLT